MVCLGFPRLVTMSPLPITGFAMMRCSFTCFSVRQLFLQEIFFPIGCVEDCVAGRVAYERGSSLSASPLDLLDRPLGVLGDERIGVLNCHSQGRKVLGGASVAEDDADIA